MARSATMHKLSLAQVVRFSAGKSITPGGAGMYPVFGSNGLIGACDEYLYENAVIIGRVGAYCGSVVYEPGKFWSSDNTLVAQPISNEFDVRFLYFLLHNANLRRYAGGAAQPLVTQTVLRQVEVNVPPLPVQRRIASILSAYDDLIENCERRIRVLDEMARALYREWFVLFRYPGHEKTPLVDSPMGRIPKGWEVRTLADLLQFKSGFAFKSGSFTQNGEHRLVTIKNVQDGSFNPECDSRMNDVPEKLPEYCILENGDILLSLTGNVGRVCLVYDAPFLLNQRVAKLVPNEAFDWAMAYCIFRDEGMRHKLEQISTGVAQQNLSPVLASKMDIAKAPRDIRQRFATIAEPLLRRIVQLYTTIKNLRKTRDILLPRLLSGQLPVEDLHETQLEESS